MFQGRIGGDAVGGVIPIAQDRVFGGQRGVDPVHPDPRDRSVSAWRCSTSCRSRLSTAASSPSWSPRRSEASRLPDPIVNFVTIAGLVFVLGLILFVNGRDIFKLVQSYF